ncbi:FBD domain [Dillenia turbinata]|uniref:FBD domain n=1 Tax=Dillenia turbinata TaxID=194707 RepID=A0AAN8ZRE1_9MAGN
MEPAAETLRDFERGHDRRNEDFLSNLPEEIISLILFFLPFKDVVVMTALSKNWGNWWKNAKNIELTDFHIYGITDNKMASFMASVEKILLQLCSDIHTFSLHCYGEEYPESCIVSWVKSAIAHKVQNLDISLRNKQPVHLPFEMMGLNLLEDLRLDGSCMLQLPSMATFSSLTEIFLMRVGIKNTNLDENDKMTLFFPVLKNLNFWGCRWYDANTVRINAPALEHFYMGSNEFAYAPFEFLLAAENLKDFTCSGVLYNNFVLRCPYTATNVSIVAEFLETLKGIEWKQVIGLRVLTLFEEICRQVKFLTLSPGTHKALGYTWFRFPIFPKLVRLEFSYKIDLFDGIFFELLQHAPVLEHLIFYAERPTEANGRAWKREILPRCFETHLKVVEIKSFLTRDIDVVSFILLNAMVLQKMDIKFSERWLWDAGVQIEMDVARVLVLALPKASSGATITVT